LKCKKMPLCFSRTFFGSRFFTLLGQSRILCRGGTDSMKPPSHYVMLEKEYSHTPLTNYVTAYLNLFYFDL
jgi:hypothetical protein